MSLIFAQQMKLLQKVLTYGLIIAGGFSLLGCEPLQSQQNPEQKKASEPVYISGNVKSERFIGGILEDEYYFSVETDSGLKTFICRGYNAPTPDTLIDAKDKVKIKLSPYYKNANPHEFNISKRDVIEINREKL